MATWLRTDHHGRRITFTYTPDARGNVNFTTQEIEGLMRTGGWEPCDCTDPHSLPSSHGDSNGGWICDNCDQPMEV